MDKIKIHAFLAATMLIGLIGFYVFLSPPFEELRELIGFPRHLPGARYNETTGAADIISSEEGDYYLARVTFVYHSVFIALLYATLIVFSNFYLKGDEKWLILDSAAIGAIITVFSAVMYSYVDRNFFWHGTFLVGLSIYFMIGLLLLLRFRPKDLIDWNIWLSGVLLLVGAVMGGWLGASFMFYREEFLEALIASRFNPDLAEENVYWRALTGHEHAMLAVVLALVFMLAIKYVGIDEEKVFLKLRARWLLIAALFGQLIMAIGAYAVFFVGGIAHLIITPSALLLIFCTLVLSFMTKTKNFISTSLKVGNFVMWIAVAIPGAIVAINLRKSILFSPPFRDPAWDYAELAYNVGHWHILLLSWGIILYIIFAFWPKDLVSSKKIMGIPLGKIALYAILVGYVIAAIGINFYMLANPPGPYSPNPYNNIWLSILVEPGLTIMGLGIAVIYILALYDYGRELIKAIF